MTYREQAADERGEVDDVCGPVLLEQCVGGGAVPVVAPHTAWQRRSQTLHAHWTEPPTHVCSNQESHSPEAIHARGALAA